MFEIIKKSTYTEKGIEGYIFDGIADYDESAEPQWSDNRWSDEVDSFYDGWIDLCRNTDDGELYGVYFDIETHEPLIWCKVKKELV